MKLSYFELEIVRNVHKALLNNKGRGLLDQTARNLKIELNKFIKILKILSDISIITRLKIKSNLFTCTLAEKDEINSELLMKKYNMVLFREDIEKKEKIEITQMKRLEEENRLLKEKINELERTIIRLKLKNSEVVSGD